MKIEVGHEVRFLEGREGKEEEEEEGGGGGSDRRREKDCGYVPGKAGVVCPRGVKGVCCIASWWSLVSC